VADTYARALLPQVERRRIYFLLNPCNYQTQDNCPSAAQALFEYLNDGLLPGPGSRLSGRPAYCPAPGAGVYSSHRIEFYTSPRTQSSGAIKSNY
jgi:hypothetical protein